MKFAICNETFQNWPLEKAFDFAADCAYRGVRIAPFTLADTARDISTRQRAEVCGLADRAGLEIVGLHWLLAKTEGLHLTSPDAEVRWNGRLLADLARLCFALGGRVMVFGSPKQRSLMPGVSRESAMNYATEVFQQILLILEETGVVIALEPLGAGRDRLFANGGGNRRADRANRLASGPFAPGLQSHGDRIDADSGDYRPKCRPGWPISTPTIPTAKARASAAWTFCLFLKL